MPYYSLELSGDFFVRKKLTPKTHYTVVNCDGHGVAV